MLNFLNNPQSYNNSDAFVAHLSNVKGKIELLNQLSNKLRFPDYFGFNWDAVYDCLCDFHWISQTGIVLVHDEIPKLDESSFDIYMQILIGAVNDWKNGEEHYFEVVFPEKSKGIIQKYLM